jgi:hypothetical protein
MFMPGIVLVVAGIVGLVVTVRFIVAPARSLAR